MVTHSPATARGLKILVAAHVPLQTLVKILVRRSNQSNLIPYDIGVKMIGSLLVDRDARNSAVHRTRNNTLMLPEAISFSTLRSSTVRSRPFLSTQLLLFRHSRVTSKTHRCARRVQAALPDVATYRRCIPPEI